MRYVDNGDVADWDFTVGDFTKDDAWHTLNLNDYLPANVKLVKVRLNFVCDTAGKYIYLHECGNVNPCNDYGDDIYVADRPLDRYYTIPCKSNRLIEYLVAAGNYAYINLFICGCWI